MLSMNNEDDKPTINRRWLVTGLAASLVAKAAADPIRDPLGVRQDFPVTSNRIYLNSAFIAPVHKAVVEASRAHTEAKAAGTLNLGAMMDSLDVVRGQFARMVNGTSDEVGLLFSTGDGENVIANGMDLRPGDNVVVDDLHYTSEFVIYRALEASRGIELRIAKHRSGTVTAADFAPLIDKRTRIVSVAWVSNQNGFRHDMRPLADLAHAHGALVYADAVQAAGMIELDVKASGVDALCSGSYKWLMSEFGVAPFYISREAMERVRTDRTGEFSIVRTDPDFHYQTLKTAKKYEGTSRSFGAVAQLRASLAFLEKVGVARIEAHTVGLAKQLYEGLVRQGYRMFTPAGNRSSIVTMYCGKRPMEDFRAAFRAANIDLTVRNGQVRISPALFNNPEEIESCLAVTKKLA